VFITESIITNQQISLGPLPEDLLDMTELIPDVPWYFFPFSFSKSFETLFICWWKPWTLQLHTTCAVLSLTTSSFRSRKLVHVWFTQPVHGRELPKASGERGSAKPCPLRSGVSPFSCYGLIVQVYVYLQQEIFWDE